MRFLPIFISFFVFIFSICEITSGSNELIESENLLDQSSTDYVDKKQDLSFFLAFPGILAPQENFSAIIYTPPQNDYDEVAKRLAGLFVDPNSTEQINYAKAINNGWRMQLCDNLFKILCWSAKHIDPSLRETGATTLFYPFGGPDIACALAFFPHMNNYILVGLEPIGTFSNIKKNITNTETLSALGKAFSSYLKKGYFITSEMMTQLSNKNVRGALYLILIGLARNGCNINSIEELSIDQEGREVVRQKGMPDCAKITFFVPGDKLQKNVYYVRIDLTANKRLSNLINFVKRLKFATLIKSASYVLHDRIASQIRNFLLNFSVAILQDDTGIPIDYFGKEWLLQPFGSYTAPPLHIFRSYGQKSLRHLFANTKPIEVPCSIGYGLSQERTNLVWAIRMPCANQPL